MTSEDNEAVQRVRDTYAAFLNAMEGASKLRMNVDLVSETDSDRKTGWVDQHGCVRTMGRLRITRLEEL